MTSYEYKNFLKQKLAGFKSDSARKALLTKYKKQTEAYLQNQLEARKGCGFLFGERVTSWDVFKTKGEIALYESLYQEIGLDQDKKELSHETN